MKLKEVSSILILLVVFAGGSIAYHSYINQRWTSLIISLAFVVGFAVLLKWTTK